MGIVVRLLGWKAEGLRCPDHEISLEQANNTATPIALLQMPNGTGKTTTLELLRAALSGSADEWNREKVRSLAKRGNQQGRGSFHVILLYNHRRMTVTLTLDFEEGTVRYSTTVGSGWQEGFHPPREVSKFLHKDFVRFFVFDGELAEQLLNRENTNAENAIENLFQLSLFNSLKNQVADHWEQQTARRGASEDRGFARRQRRVKSLEEHLATLRRVQGELKQEYSRVEADIEAKKLRFQNRLAEQEQLRERLHAATADLTAARVEVRDTAQAALREMRGPYALSAMFAREMVALKESLDRVKLPESTAREFFEELAGEEECVCGRPLDDATRSLIRDRASQYLGSEDVGLLNALKNNVTRLVGPQPDAHEAALNHTLNRLRDHCRRESELQTDLDSLQQEGVDNDPVLDQARQEIETLTRRLGELKVALARFDDPATTAGDDETFGIRVIELRFKDAEKKLAEITDTLKLKAKRDVLLRILSQAHTSARASIGQEVCDQANERIRKLMPYNTIRIERIDKCLVLRGQGGGSVGETLSVAYAFLSTLFNRTEHELPFIVDSPANPIDLAVRSKVAELIPRLTGQFVAFTISSEREGFLPALERATDTPIEYLTLFRKGATQLELAAQGQTNVTETSDGFCVQGRDFFHAFHQETEGTNDAV